MSESDLQPFVLVGGTALALQLGHRISFDLDLFGYPGSMDIPMISGLLNQYGEVEQLNASKNIFSARVDDIKVDFVRYAYPLLLPFLEIEGIRMASLRDIAAMKLAAITGRGRKRDFTDLFFLLKKFSLEEMLNFHQQKYPDGNRFLVLKSLNYFTDAEEDEDLVLLQSADWPEVKKTIESAVNKMYG
jgi:predicted nucleotidyltransferase component of viral defense system